MLMLRVCSCMCERQIVTAVMLEIPKQQPLRYATNSEVNDYIYVRTLNHVAGTNQLQPKNSEKAFTCFVTTCLTARLLNAGPYFLTEIFIFQDN